MRRPASRTSSNGSRTSNNFNDVDVPIAGASPLKGDVGGSPQSSRRLSAAGLTDSKKTAMRDLSSAARYFGQS